MCTSVVESALFWSHYYFSRVGFSAGSHTHLCRSQRTVAEFAPGAICSQEGGISYLVCFFGFCCRVCIFRFRAEKARAISPSDVPGTARPVCQEKEGASAGSWYVCPDCVAVVARR